MNRFARFRRSVAPTLYAVVGLAVGCAGPAPELFPAVPLAVHSAEDGTEERRYDTDGDGRADYHERLAADGVVGLLRFDTDGDGTIDLEVDRAAVCDRSEGGDNSRHLILLLDSVPFEMVRDLWEQGRLRLFHPPSRVISPFPVMTDVSFAELFGVSPCPGAESEYFDGRRLRDGWSNYPRADNSPWFAFVDYRSPYATHGFVYLHPNSGFDRDLRRIQQRFLERAEGDFVGYVVSSSALGAKLGRDGHQVGLIRIDRFCQWTMHRLRGRVHITLLSDHGHDLRHSRRIRLRELLSRFGYRVADRLRQPRDVVVPEFGMVSYAAVYTTSPAEVARDLVGVEGVELTAYRDRVGEVIVLSRDGRAVISRRDPLRGGQPGAYRYRPSHGDPLRLTPVLEALRERGDVDSEGFVDDRRLFEATAEHTYPDAVHRLWRAFHGLIEHTPDVLVSVSDGYYCGSPFMSAFLDLVGVHGNLNQAGSSAVAMTTAGALPPVLRMEDLAAALEGVGVRLKSR